MKRTTLHTTLSSSLPFLCAALLVSPSHATDEQNKVKAENLVATGEVATAADGEGAAAPDAPAAAAESAASESPTGETEQGEIQEIADEAIAPLAESKFPLGASFSLTNSVGTGTFAPGYTNNPSVSTALNVRPSFNIPKLLGDWQPAASLSASISADIEWMSSYTGTARAGTYDRQVRIRDMKFGASLPALISEPFSGISVSPALSLTVPLSVSSRYQNRLVGFGGAVPVAWSLETLLGNFAVSYSAGGSAWAFSETSATQPCDAQETPFLNIGQDPTSGLTDEPMILSREGEKSEVNGQCIVKGRQTVASVSNAGSMSWSYPDFFGSHSLSLGMGVYHLFRRPIADLGDGMSSQYSNRSGTTLGSNTPSELTDGSLSYTYGLPLDLNMSITAGVYSLQTMFDQEGDFRFPWFDFNVQGGNNFTTGYVTLNLAL